jgi:hypothetical protein
MTAGDMRLHASVPNNGCRTWTVSGRGQQVWVHLSVADMLMLID